MYKALYRKYRPKNFEEVVSQTSIVKTLQNSVKNHHITHAYLFSGPRGTGKTTVAKIFARLVNCSEENGIICEKCPNCLYSSEKDCMDIIEIDAASNNGVDEIRELRNKVTILPTQLKYKVYIIDEVHMLSIGAFNALLKTLEEPPSHVIFILATTDPQKIPSTIISRCQCYYFKKITVKEIVQQLLKITKMEKINITEETLEAIALAADGGLRDAIGLLDKTISFKEDNIILDDFLEINGNLSQEDLNNLETNIFSYDSKIMIECIEQYYNDGKDLIQILKQLMLDLKNKLVNFYLQNVDLPFDEQIMIDFVNLLNDRLNEVKRADDVKMYIEILFLHFINQKENGKILTKESSNSDQIISRDIFSRKNEQSKMTKNIIETMEENNFDETLSSNSMDSNTMNNDFMELMEIRSKNCMIEAKKSELEKEIVNWKLLENFTFDQNEGYLACDLLDAVPRASSNDLLVISYEYEAMIEKISSHWKKMVKFYQQKTNSQKQLAFISDEKWNFLKKQYIALLKSGKNFIYQKEPDIIEMTDSSILQNLNNNSKSSTEEAIALFGDVVEIQ